MEGERVSTRILISDRGGGNFLTPINHYNLENGHFAVDTVPIGCRTVWPFGKWQTQHDMRKRQMERTTMLNTYKGHRSTGKGFIIIRISEGAIHGVSSKFNGYLMLLQRMR